MRLHLGSTMRMRMFILVLVMVCGYGGFKSGEVYVEV